MVFRRINRDRIRYRKNHPLKYKILKVAAGAVALRYGARALPYLAAPVANQIVKRGVYAGLGGRFFGSLPKRKAYLAPYNGWHPEYIKSYTQRKFNKY